MIASIIITLSVAALTGIAFIAYFLHCLRSVGREIDNENPHE